MSGLHELQHPRDPAMPEIDIRLYRTVQLTELRGSNGLTRANLWRCPERRAVMRERFGITQFGDEIYPINSWVTNRVTEVFGPPLAFNYRGGYTEQASSQLAALWSWYVKKEYIRNGDLRQQMAGVPIPYQALMELDLVDGLFHRLMIWRSASDEDSVLVGVTCEVVDGRYVAARYTRIIRWGRKLASELSLERTAQHQMPRYVVDAIVALQGGVRPMTTELSTTTSRLPVVRRSDFMSQEPAEAAPAQPSDSEPPNHLKRVVILLVIIFLVVLGGIGAAAIWPDVFPFSLLY